MCEEGGGGDLAGRGDGVCEGGGDLAGRGDGVCIWEGRTHYSKKMVHKTPKQNTVQCIIGSSFTLVTEYQEI